MRLLAQVAPHTGAWIETLDANATNKKTCRTPHGCVDDNADMEMYKGDSKFRITRITAFQSVCPICSVQIQIDYGKPDHKELLFGRCRESPLAHVYSFDRDTLKGFFLGHEGYLK